MLKNQPIRALSILFVIVILTSLCSCSALLPPTTSGINGKALVGPVAPVQKEGDVNEKPFPDAVIFVMDEAGKRKIAEVVSGKDGLFSVNLAPGAYLLVPQTPKDKPLPVGQPQEAAVEKDRFTFVTIRYDSGIR